jgi:IS1 family transposase/transposase-like protein
MTNHSALPIVSFLGLLISYVIVNWPVLYDWWLVWGSMPASAALPSDEADASSAQGQILPVVCPACAAEKGEHGQARSQREPPPYIEQKRGHPREVDTSSHFCPNEDCRYYGWLGLGNIRSNGHPNSGSWRQLECKVCGKTFLETLNTIFYRKQVPAETIWRVLVSLAEGVGIRKTARIFDLDPNTVQAWLEQAAKHMEVVSCYLLHDLHLSQVQVDELWALLGRRNGDERAKHWVWVGVDASTKLWLATVVGDRSQACAQLLIHAIQLLLAPGCLPLFTSDQWSAYAAALLTHFGQWVPVPRQHALGRPPKPRWQALPGLLYAQVVKQREKGWVVSVTKRAIFGSLEAIEAALQLSGISQVINTAFIERLNLTIRQHVAALGRKVNDLAKTISGLRDQLSLARAYHNFCLPHASLRLPLPQPVPTLGTGSPKKWQSRTPAMAAGVTNRVWRMEELLLLRIPPWQQNVQASA